MVWALPPWLTVSTPYPLPIITSVEEVAGSGLHCTRKVFQSCKPLRFASIGPCTASQEKVVPTAMFRKTSVIIKSWSWCKMQTADLQDRHRLCNTLGQTPQALAFLISVSFCFCPLPSAAPSSTSSPASPLLQPHFQPVTIYPPPSTTLLCLFLHCACFSLTLWTPRSSLLSLCLLPLIPPLVSPPALPCCLSASTI